MRTLKINRPVQNFPRDDLIAKIPQWTAQGKLMFPKFTCDHCHERVMLEVPNIFPEYPTCPKCGEISHFVEGNYALSAFYNPNSEVPDNKAAMDLYFKGMSEIIEIEDPFKRS